jgi:hypothetical protein
LEKIIGKHVSDKRHTWNIKNSYKNNNSKTNNLIKNVRKRLGLMLHTYNPSYSRGRDKRIAAIQVIERPYLRNKQKPKD